MEMWKREHGFYDLCDYYNELGMNAIALHDDSPDALKQGFIKQDIGYIKVVGKNFDLVTIRGKGSSTGGSSHTVNGVTVKSTQRLPYEFHHIVRKENIDENMFKVKLEKKKKGMFSKEVIGVTWEGGRFAQTLNADPQINAAIMGFLNSEDNMKIEPDKKKQVVRVVLSRITEIKTGLIFGINHSRGFPPKDAVDVIDKIAGLIKQMN